MHHQVDGYARPSDPLDMGTIVSSSFFEISFNLKLNKYPPDFGAEKKRILVHLETIPWSLGCCFSVYIISAGHLGGFQFDYWNLGSLQKRKYFWFNNDNIDRVFPYFYTTKGFYNFRLRMTSAGFEIGLDDMSILYEESLGCIGGQESRVSLGRNVHGDFDYDDQWAESKAPTDITAWRFSYLYLQADGTPETISSELDQHQRADQQSDPGGVALLDETAPGPGDIGYPIAVPDSRVGVVLSYQFYEVSFYFRLNNEITHSDCQILLNIGFASNLRFSVEICDGETFEVRFDGWRHTSNDARGLVIHYDNDLNDGEDYRFEAQVNLRGAEVFLDGVLLAATDSSYEGNSDVSPDPWDLSEEGCELDMSVSGLEDSTWSVAIWNLIYRELAYGRRRRTLGESVFLQAGQMPEPTAAPTAAPEDQVGRGTRGVAAVLVSRLDETPGFCFWMPTTKSFESPLGWRVLGPIIPDADAALSWAQDHGVETFATGNYGNDGIWGLFADRTTGNTWFGTGGTPVEMDGPGHA
jgi:hypothetical protein